MTFWIITGAMALLVLAVLSQAMIRARSGAIAETAEYDLRVYRDQLAEVERDVARGVLSAEDAERVRTEISRRILAVDAENHAPDTQPMIPQAVVLGFIALVLLPGTLALYWQYGAPGYGDLALETRKEISAELRANRPSQQAAQDSLTAYEEPDLDDQSRALIERLRAVVQARPEDIQGLEFLAQYEATLGNFVVAADARGRILDLKGDAATAEDYAAYGEQLFYAAGGYVSPEAEAAFRAALARNSTEGRSLYYIGVMMVQTGRPDIAFGLWDRLLRQGPADAPWIAPIQEQIMPIAQLAGVNYTMPTIGSAATRGPTAEDIEAAAEMTAEERMEMIGSMIDGLSNRLATEGGPPQDWARLITSLAITGQPAQARAVFDNAMEVFEGNPSAIDTIRRAGSQAGVAE